MDGLARDLEGHLRIVRLPIQSPAGLELGERWRAHFTPTFILFDAEGREVWRGLSVPSRASVRGLLGLS